MHKLKVARVDKRMTQKELADKLGISVPYLCGFETGKRRPRTDQLLKMCEVLEVSPNYLLEWEE